MAYTINCYFTDSHILSTRIQTKTIDEIHYYGEGRRMLNVNADAVFTATPADGCQFTRWVYQIGSQTATTQYSYMPTFSYSQAKNIYIYAEGEPIPETPTVRPSKFYWTCTKTSGATFNLTAAEWNGLTANINAVREYCGYSPYSFTTAYRGYNFTAAMYNQAVNAIKGISGYGYYLSTVSKGDTVTAYRLNILRDELNAIS